VSVARSGVVTPSNASSPAAITDLLLAWNGGDAEALERLVPLVEAELQRLAHQQMRKEAPGHPLQTTALVHEAYLRLIDGSRVNWQDRAHFFAVSSRLMRRILIDVARARKKLKRGGGAVWISLDDTAEIAEAPDAEVIALDDALTALAAFDERKSRVVELRFFGGLTVDETAEALRVSPITVVRDWTLARAWLAREMRGADGA
jgi:RNA polymerase sigma-70 factor (ECF subfamily)